MHVQCQKIRKGSKDAAGTGKVTVSDSSLLPSILGSPSSSDQLRSLPGRAAVIPPEAIELFSGSGHLSHKLQLQHVRTEPWDIINGSNFDLLHRGVANRLKDHVKSGHLKFLWLGIPCVTVSRARRPGGGPPPLRSNEHLLGYPDLVGKNKEKVDSANRLFVVCFELIQLCIKHNVSFVVENPLTSMLWKFPRLVQLFKRAGAVEVRVDFCQFGMPWRKSTKLVGNLSNLLSLEAKCTGKLCSASNKSHFRLEGRDDNGVFWTKRAEPYPAKLCFQIAKLVAANNSL